MMDNSEAMFWLAVVQQANRGDKEAMDVLRQEDDLRTQQGLPPIIVELKAVSERTKYQEEVEREFRKHMKM